MDGTHIQRGGVLNDVSNALVKLHKEQFGRGPTIAHSHFGGRNALMCVMENALLPAERKMVELGDDTRVRETRMAFQAATQSEFVATVEQIVSRKVRAFSSGVDPNSGTVFECYCFEPESGGDSNGAVPREYASELGEYRQAGA